MVEEDGEEKGRELGGEEVYSVCSHFVGLLFPK